MEIQKRQFEPVNFDVDKPDHTATVRVVYPVDALASRKAITGLQYEAAKILYQHWAKGGFAGARATDYAKPLIDSGRAGASPQEVAEESRQQCSLILKAIGAKFSYVVTAVCLYEVELKNVPIPVYPQPTGERDRRTIILTCLRHGLDEAVKFLGLANNRKSGRTVGSNFARDTQTAIEAKEST